MLSVLVVDDSPTARALIVSILSDDDELRIAGEASCGDEAVRMTARLRPDVVTMDINMPGMSGFEATKQIMIDTPTPIVIVSENTMVDEVATGMRVLRAGALTLLRKPPGPGAEHYELACAELVETVKSMADVKVVRHFRPPPAELPLTASADSTRARQVAASSDHELADSLPGESTGGTSRGIIALAASTGGPPAIQHVLAELREDFSLPIVVVQHIAKGFSEGFAQWLDSTVTLPVCTARAGAPLTAGQVYIAPEDGHLGVASNHTIEISSVPLIGGFRPSASYLFNSVAGVYRDATLAVIMTGMGSDGVEGLRAVKQCGGTVFAQDEATSVVFGMPGAAIRANVVDEILGLDRIAAGIEKFALRQMNR